MNRPLTATLVALAAALTLVLSLSGQDKGKANKAKKDDPDAPKVRPLPDDKRLLALHLDFVKQAEKLGKEYEADKQWGKARAVYEEILKLVPQYPPAQAKLAEMLQHERAAKSVTVTVKANEGWQNTGIDLIADKPVSLVASGKWTFHLQVETNAEGLTIPKELRDFNPGCLIGMIPDPADPENNMPFVVAGSKQFIAERSGRLHLRMYDTDPRDNSGELKVEIRGTFKESK
jgi:hypothetical protein